MRDVLGVVHLASVWLSPRMRRRGPDLGTSVGRSSRKPRLLVRNVTRPAGCSGKSKDCARWGRSTMVATGSYIMRFVGRRSCGKKSFATSSVSAVPGICDGSTKVASSASSSRCARDHW